jgi:hypothetical protein
LFHEKLGVLKWLILYKKDSFDLYLKVKKMEFIKFLGSKNLKEKERIMTKLSFEKEVGKR